MSVHPSPLQISESTQLKFCVALSNLGDNVFEHFVAIELMVFTIEAKHAFADRIVRIQGDSFTRLLKGKVELFEAFDTESRVRLCERIAADNSQPQHLCDFLREAFTVDLLELVGKDCMRKLCPLLSMFNAHERSKVLSSIGIAAGDPSDANDELEESF